MTLHQSERPSRSEPTGASDASWSQISVFRLKPTALFLACLLLVVSSVAWRKGVYYSGGTDVVVLTKAALTVLAAALAFFMPRRPGTWSRHRMAPALWTAGYLIISVVGGAMNGDTASSIVLAIRLGLTAFVIVLLVASHPWEAVISAIASSMLLLAVFSAVTGISSLAETGRLYGGIPPINANEICLLVTVPAVLVFWKCLHGKASVVEYAALVPMLAMIWLTGSRTGLGALVVALLLMMLMAPRVPALLLGAGLLAVPAVLYVIFFTSLVADFAGRGDPQGVTTLNSRTVAWQAAFDYADTLGEMLFGSGLALKQIPVTAMYRSEQILDSTWISAILQVGYVGVALLVLFVLTTLLRAFRLPYPERTLVLSLAGIVSFVSVLESGMFDATPAFIVFFTMTMFAHRVVNPTPPLPR